MGTAVLTNTFVNTTFATGNTLILCENTSGGMLFSNNLVVNTSSSTGTLIVLNALSPNFMFSGNMSTTTGGTGAGMGRTFPVSNTAGTTALSAASLVVGNSSGLPDFKAYRYT